MAAPVQVVLDAGSYVKEFRKPAGGSKKDIFAGKDDDFQEHRDRLVRQVRSLAASKGAFERSSIAVAAVELKPVALAKSNRPKQLFDPGQLPSMGTARQAEVLIQVTPTTLRSLASRIGEADDTVPMKQTLDRKTNRTIEVPNPSQLRCDVGVVENVVLWDSERRLSLPLKEMSRWFRGDGTPLSLVVRLFRFQGREGDHLQHTELEHLQVELQALGCTTELDSDRRGNPFQQDVLLVKWGKRSSQASVENWIEALPKVIDLLSHCPIVRSIHVPARITNSIGAGSPPLPPPSPVQTAIPTPTPGVSYPVVGVIDGGVCASLNSWVEPGDPFLVPSDIDRRHGTEIAGLLVMGQQLNGTDVCPEPDGCSIVDIGLIPREQGGKFSVYYENSATFFRKVEGAVMAAKKAHNARVFNFSLNLSVPSSTESDYCYETEWLDRIAWKHDVVFIISAGNLPAGGGRAEWPADSVRALSILAQRLTIDEAIRAPADSLANISVSAINPPRVLGKVPAALASYSRRGPSRFGGLKPDLAHFGGCSGSPSGLQSVAEGGSLKDVSGTSFAAPLVAKTMARYCQLIEGTISRELMIGLVIHHSKIPDLYSKSPLSDQAKDLIGFGVPLAAEPSITGKDSSITLIFETSILKGQRMEFKFAWPKSLVKQGKCRGRGRLTLVSRPAVDGRDGEEFARTQLDAHLNQLDLNGKTKGGKFTIALPDALRGQNGKAFESVQRRHQMKWGPVKVYEFDSPSGVGESSEWRLQIESLERAAGETPEYGIQFAAILTIEDIKGEARVFDDLRQDLVSRSVQLSDLRVAGRTRARRTGRSP